MNVSAQQLNLLRAVCAPPAQAEQAWSAWKAGVDLDRVEVASQQLFPLLARRLPELGIRDPQHHIYRGFARRCWFENQRRWGSIRPLLESDRWPAGPALLLKGMALALAYQGGDLSLRPMNDVDVCVGPAGAPVVSAWLRGRGWQSAPRAYSPGGELFAAWHGYGYRLAPRDGLLPVDLDLHGHPLQARCLDRVTEALLQRSRPLPAAPGLRVLSPAAALLHTAVHGLQWSAAPGLLWVADAALLAGQPDLDWNDLLTLARQTGCSAAVGRCLRLLEAWAGVVLPEGVVSRLETQADWVERTELAVRLAPRGRMGNLPLHASRYLALCHLSRTLPTPWGLAAYFRGLLGCRRWSDVPAALRSWIGTSLPARD